jgi:hypothetical protein
MNVPGSGHTIDTGNIVTGLEDGSSQQGNHSFPPPSTYSNLSTIVTSSMYDASAFTSAPNRPNRFGGTRGYHESGSEHGYRDIQPGEGNFPEFEGSSMSQWILNSGKQRIGRKGEFFQVADLIHIFKPSQ